MDWKTVTENILKLKNLADNEEIKSKLEGLSLYNCRLKQLLDGEENSQEASAALSKESELKNNTLTKIYDILQQSKNAQTPEEEFSKLIECFLYIDNYLSLYCEPELFFIRGYDKPQLCDSVELLNSKTKFEDIMQSMFFFQELNTKAHASLQSLCGFLKESKENIFDFIYKIDHALDRLDFFNQTVLGWTQPDKALEHLYCFILIINYTAQKLLIHRFAGVYPSNVNKKVLREALKHKERALERIKDQIIKRASVIKQLKEKISEPMIQQTWFDQRCAEVLDEEAVVKREQTRQKEEAAYVIINKDKINKCCEISYWTAFLMANDKKTAPEEKNAEADEWFRLYLQTAGNNKYEILYSLRKFILANKAETARAFSAIKIKADKKEKIYSVLNKTIPVRIAAAIVLALSAVFIYLIICGAKKIVL